MDKAENTKRLARNTMLLYFRSIFCLILSLYSSRLILQALGVDDYGINNAVAGFAAMFWLVTGSLSSAISRFLTFEQGTGNYERQKQIFSISLNLMIVFALVVLVLAVTAGEWFVGNKMTIPEGREVAAIWAFRFAVLTVMTGLIVSPCNSAIISHERMGIYAGISVVEAIMRLALALFLAFGHYTADRLILYAGLWALCTVGLHIFAITYTALKFPECRFRLFFEKKLFKELFSYAGWNFVGSFSGTMCNQGVNTLINVYLGPAVNAARGLSNTVTNAITMFVNNFTLALTPQITKAYAQKDEEYVKFLTFRGSKFAFYIFFFIALPVILEAQFVFTLWLGTVPEYTVNFNRLTLIACLLGVTYSIFVNIQNASGDIKKYNLIISTISLCQFPLAWVFLKVGARPEVIYFIVIGTTLINFIVTHHLVRQKISYSYGEIFRDIYFPELKVVVCSSILPTITVCMLPYGWWRFLITDILCVLCSTPTILYLGCTKAEREHIYNAAKRFVSRFKK